VNKKLVEGEDFYYSEAGFIVMTERYHIERGFCCGNGCRHCPYEYEHVPEPQRTELLNNKENRKPK
jgi:hypothetical protein